MARTRRKKARRRNPLVWTSGFQKGKVVKDLGSKGPQKISQLLNQGKIRMVGTAAPTQAQVATAIRTSASGTKKTKSASSKLRALGGVSGGAKKAKRSLAAKKGAATRKKNMAAKKRKSAKKKTTRKKTTRKSYGRKAAPRKKAGTSGRKAARRPSTKKATRRKSTRKKYVGYVYSAPRAKAARRAKKKVGTKVHTTARYGYRVSTKRRKAGTSTGRLSKQGRVNPGRRKRRRRNPGFLSVMKETVTSIPLWRCAGQGALGFSAATVIPGAIESISGGRIRNSGATGVGLSALSTGLATVAALMVERKWSNRLTTNAAKNVACGGLMATAFRGLAEFLPMVAEFLKLPDVRQPVIQVPGVAGLGNFLELRGMGQGNYRVPMNALMGMGQGNYLPDLNEQLVAGESRARATRQMDGMGDWAEISGMGQGYPGQYGSGGYDPFHAGVSGMGDWYAELNPGTAAGQQAIHQLAWEPSSAEVF